MLAALSCQAGDRVPCAFMIYSALKDLSWLLELSARIIEDKQVEGVTLIEYHAVLSSSHNTLGT